MNTVKNSGRCDFNGGGSTNIYIEFSSFLMHTILTSRRQVKLTRSKPPNIVNLLASHLTKPKTVVIPIHIIILIFGVVPEKSRLMDNFIIVFL